MKISIIAYNFSESTIPLAKHLACMGIDVDYYFITHYKQKEHAAFEYKNRYKFWGLKKLNTHNSPKLFEYLKDVNINPHLLILPRYFIILKLVKLFLYHSFARRIKNINYNFINIVGQDNDLLLLHKFLRKSKIIHTLHETFKHYSEQIVNNELIDFLANNKIPIIVHSNYSKNILYENFRIDATHRVKIIKFGLFETYLNFKKGIVDPIENTILYYGLIRPYKGLGILIDAVELVQKSIPNVHLIIAGSGSDKKLDQLKNIKNHTIINRFITNDEIVEFNQKSQIVVCPYLSASQSGIIMTSFLFSKPIIASNVGAFSEIIINEKNGLLINPNDAVLLANKIIYLLTDDNKIKSIKANIEKEFSDSKWQWDTIAEETYRFYIDSF